MRPSTSKLKSKEPVRRASPPGGKQRVSKPKASRSGVVLFCLLGSKESHEAKAYTPSKLVQMLQAGLPFSELQDLQSSLAISSERLAPMLGLSKATFHRRKGRAGTLPPAVSDRVLRYARLLGQASKVFHGPDAAKLWLNAPQVGLGGAVPLDYAKTEIGAREVENLLGRIEYGVYS
jgi:putative toxin-antitoxin system antitoxin component (TIGR02293 family)